MKMLKLSEEYIQDLMVRMAHHSTAIEGNRISLDGVSSILLREYVSEPMTIKELHEVENYKVFMKSMLEAISSSEELSLKLIKDFHKALCKDAIAGEAGAFKKIQNMIAGATFTPTRPYLVQEELTSWIADAKMLFHNANDLKSFFNALARLHIRLERIHPFSDGNGSLMEMEGWAEA